jgi:hypothetical protein
MDNDTKNHFKESATAYKRIEQFKKNIEVAQERFDAIINHHIIIPPFTSVDKNSSPEEIIQLENEISILYQMMNRYKKDQQQAQVELRKKDDGVYPFKIKKHTLKKEDILKTEYEILEN